MIYELMFFQKGFHPTLVKAIGFQLFSSIAWLHDYTLIHTDLKPENILFRDSEYIKDRDGYRVRRKWGALCFKSRFFFFLSFFYFFFFFVCFFIFFFFFFLILRRLRLLLILL